MTGQRDREGAGGLIIHSLMHPADFLGSLCRLLGKLRP